MVEENKIICKKCGSDNCVPTGVTIYTIPARKEYMCFSCGHKFARVDNPELEEKAPKGYQQRPELKGCFNCMNYSSDQYYTKFTCLKAKDFNPDYTDVCDFWEKYVEPVREPSLLSQDKYTLANGKEVESNS